MHTTFGMGTVVATGTADDVVVLGAAAGDTEVLTGAFVDVSVDTRAWVVVDACDTEEVPEVDADSAEDSESEPQADAPAANPTITNTAPAVLTRLLTLHDML